MHFNISKEYRAHLLLVFALSMAIISTRFISSNITQVYAETSVPYATGMVNSEDGINVRKSPSIFSAKVLVLTDNEKVSILKEVFVNRSLYSSKYKWYYVSTKGLTGYVRSDLIDNVKYSKIPAKTSEYLNYRRGAGIDMNKVGTLNLGTTIQVVLTATSKPNGSTWYKICKDSKYYYVSAQYVVFSSAADSINSFTSNENTGSTSSIDSSISTAPTSDAAKALHKKSTNGGAERIVYTFTEKNCTKKFSATGYNKIYTPQAVAYTGNNYYFLFATSSGQRIVQYTKKGKRVEAVNFNTNRGHLNGMTWNPNTKKFYIFKGNQCTIYTWDPFANKFGKLTTPYSSSGVGYDPITNKIYCSSQTGIRVYSADDKFTHLKLFSRCKHSGTTYIQDCGAYNGIVFHGVSGSNKKTINYIDFYRASNGSYLGTIKLTIGEIESFAVSDTGYLELLINTSGNTDYIWKTPLNVNELA